MFKGRQKHYKLYEEFIQTIDLRNLLVYWKGIYSTKILPKPSKNDLKVYTKLDYRIELKNLQFWSISSSVC